MFVPVAWGLCFSVLACDVPFATVAYSCVAAVFGVPLPLCPRASVSMTVLLLLEFQLWLLLLWLFPLWCSRASALLLPLLFLVQCVKFEAWPTCSFFVPFLFSFLSLQLNQQ